MRRKVFWQLSPLATRAIYIADRVEHLARVCLALAPTGAGQRDHRLDNSPLFVVHITRVTSTSRLVFLALFVAPHGGPAFLESAAIHKSQEILTTQELSKRALKKEIDVAGVTVTTNRVAVNKEKHK